MYDLSLALFGSTALVLVTLTALWFIRQGTARSELADAARQRFAGCGMALLTLAVFGCVVAFAIAAIQLNKTPATQPVPVIHIDTKRL